MKTETKGIGKGEEKRSENADFVPEHDGDYIARIVTSDGKTDIDYLTQTYKDRNKLNSKGKKYNTNTILLGETGTGKTHAVRHVCNTLQLPYVRVNLNGATTPEDLIGSLTAKEDGKLGWEDGILIRFVKYGGVFVCDEINMANADILSLLNPLLDDERRLVLTAKNGKAESVIHAHPDFWFVATMNPDYEGTKPLNKALWSRFKVKLTYDYDAKVEKKLIPDRDILKVADTLRKMFKKGEIVTPVSTRTLLYFCENKEQFGVELAIQIFLNEFEKDEAQAIESVLELTFKEGIKGNALLDDADSENAKKGEDDA